MIKPGKFSTRNTKKRREKAGDRRMNLKRNMVIPSLVGWRVFLSLCMRCAMYVGSIAMLDCGF